ncbi:ABC transporter substrate-binding protein [Paenibacillus hamazuiensis]|uniref:ABC transporter substrate-binding protein n=1 Tax=Paenibacillus hamazuiensis TaxID=2936508 RepID=UPI00200F9DF5|nr:ABC transporter substrate-binding protein [Paenibacillus hamazuiensis]
MITGGNYLKLKTILLLSMTAAVGLAGCTAAKPVEQGKPAQPADNGKPYVELSMYFVGPYPQKEQDEVYAAANKIIKEKINATVKFNGINWGDYDKKMQVLMASGEPYDIAFTSNWINNYRQNTAKGGFLPLDELLPKHAPKLYASVDKRYWDAVRINGKIYGVINEQIFARSSHITVPKEYADKYQIDLAGAKFNLRKLEPVLERMKEDKIPVPFTSSWIHLSEYHKQEFLAGDKVPGAIRLDSTPENLKVFNQYESDEFKSYIELKRDWQMKGYLGGDKMLAITDATSLLNEKKIAISTGGTYKPGGDAEYELVRGFPGVSAALSDFHIATSGVTSTLFGINRSSKNPERALEFLELLYTDKQLYNLLNFGMEGKHYTKQSGDYIEPVKGSNYNPGTPWELGTTFNAYLLKGQPADVWEQTKKLNASAAASPVMGFSADLEPIKTEIAQVTAVTEKYMKALDLGLMDLGKDYPQFIAQLKSAGADKIVAELQKQVDEWKKMK